MGRYIKNASITTGSHAVVMPLSTNTLGPQFPVTGQVKYNEDTNKLQVYVPTGWKDVATVGEVNVVKDYFLGDGTNSTFAMAKSYLPGQEANMLVFVANVFQNPIVTYTVSGSNITFVGVPANGVPVVILHNFNSTATV
jgi:hypothetical protein